MTTTTLGLYAYRVSRKLFDDDVPFDALIAAAMRKADYSNTQILRSAFPEVWDELMARYHAPGGVLPGEDETQEGA